MDVTPLIPHGSQVIQSYTDGGFRVSGIAYDRAVVVFPDRTEMWAGAGAAEHFSIDDFQALFDGAAIDVLLVGCGGRGDVPFDLRLALRDRGWRVEFMDTGAACRTYNVLMAEGRDVAALLLPLSLPL